MNVFVKRIHEISYNFASFPRQKTMIMKYDKKENTMPRMFVTYVVKNLMRMSKNFKKSDH